jgi:hypothetical protein
MFLVPMTLSFCMTSASIPQEVCVVHGGTCLVKKVFVVPMVLGFVSETGTQFM